MSSPSEWVSQVKRELNGIPCNRNGLPDITECFKRPTLEFVVRQAPEVIAEFFVELFKELIFGKPADGNRLTKYSEERALVGVVGRLLQKKLPFNQDQLSVIAQTTLEVRDIPALDTFVRLYEDEAKRASFSKTLANAVRNLANYFKDCYRPELKKKGVVLESLVSDSLPLAAGEAWSDAVISYLSSANSNHAAVWRSAIEHCLAATASEPSNKWLAAAAEKITAVGLDEFKQRLREWVPLVDERRTQEVPWVYRRDPDPNELIVEPNATALKGLAWMMGGPVDAELPRLLTILALTSYRKPKFSGPRLLKVGNACVYSLSAMPGLDGVGQLALLKARVKSPIVQKMLEKALNATAERLNIPREEIEEMAVPAYGLTGVGVCEEAMGEFAVRLTVAADGSAELVWLKPDAKPQKSVPAAVKASHAEELKELQAAAKDIQRMLPAQRERLDSLFLAQKSWPSAVWRERYRDHPLVGVLARRLIWEFTTDGKATAGMWRAAERRSPTRHEPDTQHADSESGAPTALRSSRREEAPFQCGVRNADAKCGIESQSLVTSAATQGEIVDLDLRPVAVNDTTVVRLWHPIGKDVDEVLAWREWLESQQIQQPFKQAHREVYVLTDAERNTGVYSNRFAAHILRQHQCNALCAARGWKNKLRLMVDDTYPPASRLLPQWGLRAEFWIEGIGENYGADTNESGVYLRVATDQVRFYRLPANPHENAGDPIPLDQIPPLVFSEIMRDVDLFVGVASVGNDPTWNDGGPDGRFRDYWQSYSFGDLSATAQTRRAILERLVPRLKIADRCSFVDKFLVVRGQLRNYNIHLGSGNILMTPNDQYLCIVAKQSAAAGDGKVFLPFEGDTLLSVILSKACLLAADDRITDTTIVSQLKR